MTVGKLSGLAYYPVKSLPGISLDRAVLTPRGIEFDRMWMLVTESGRFITQREEHRLALLDVRSDEDGFRISDLSGAGVLLPRRATSGRSIGVRVWKDEFAAVQGPPEIADFFSSYLGYSCSVVFMPESAGRMAREFAPDGTPLSFADAYPGLLTADASIDDLNTRTETYIAMKRFRPNIVVSGSTAYDEDGWYRVKVGEAEITCVKPCARCVLTTVDPETGTAGKEPLRTLARYRRIENDVYFGQNFVVSRPGTVRVGDAVTVIERKALLFSETG